MSWTLLYNFTHVSEAEYPYSYTASGSISNLGRVTVKVLILSQLLVT